MVTLEDIMAQLNANAEALDHIGKTVDDLHFSFEKDSVKWRGYMELIIKMVSGETYGKELIKMIQAVPDADDHEIGIMFVMGIYAAQSGDQEKAKKFFNEILPQIAAISKGGKNGEEGPANNNGDKETVDKHPRDDRVHPPGKRGQD